MLKRMLTVLLLSATLLIVVGATLTTAAVTCDVPSGFTIVEFANVSSVVDYGVGSNPTNLAIGPDGRVYVSLVNGRIYAFEDTNGDDQQDAAQLFADEPDFPGGMVWNGDSLYISAPDESWLGKGQIRELQDLDDDGDALSPTESDRLISGLPETVQGIAVDDSGRFYVGIAAGCDNCTPADPRMGAVVRFEYDSIQWNYQLYALGLHSPHDLGFLPGTGDLFAPDDGRDDLGPGAPPDEWNSIQGGQSYGWPHCWEGGSDPGWEIYCTFPAHPTTLFPPHSSPAGLAFYSEKGLPGEYMGNAFLAVRNLGTVFRMIVTPNGSGGYSTTALPFATNLQDPIDVAISPDGAIYVADYAEKRIWCIRAQPDLSRSWKQGTPIGPDPGDLITYTIHVVADGPGSPFVLTDTIPLSTTFKLGSADASNGSTYWSGSYIRWTGVASTNEEAVLTFTVQVNASVPTHTVILNTATLSGTEDGNSPYTLQARAIVSPLRHFLTMVLRSY